MKRIETVLLGCLVSLNTCLGIELLPKRTYQLLIEPKTIEDDQRLRDEKNSDTFCELLRWDEKDSALKLKKGDSIQILGSHIDRMAPNGFNPPTYYSEEMVGEDTSDYFSGGWYRWTEKLGHDLLSRCNKAVGFTPGLTSAECTQRKVEVNSRFSPLFVKARLLQSGTFLSLQCTTFASYFMGPFSEYKIPGRPIQEGIDRMMALQSAQ